MLFIDLVAVAMASFTIIVALQKGSIFASLRSRMELKDTWYAKLFLCPLCLSYQVPFWLIVLFLIPSLCFNDSWSWIFKMPIYSLVVTFMLSHI